MTYNQARRLLSDGDVEAIRRSAWRQKDEDAAWVWNVEEATGRGYICFVSSSDAIYQFGPWGGRQEDLDADDWEVTHYEEGDE
jgi:hypothetical protein